MDALAVEFRRQLIGFFRREGQNRRHHAQERVQHLVHGADARYPVHVVGQGDIEPVFQHIEIERRQIDRAEVVERMVDGVKFIVRIGLPHALDELVQAADDEPVDLHALCQRNRVLPGVETLIVPQIAQQEAARVPDPSVGLGHAVENLRGDADVFPVILPRHPEPQYLGAVFLDNLFGRDRVAQGLAHLLALAVHHVAVGEHLAVGRGVPYTHGGEQGAVEPAAMLIAALQIHVRRPRQLLSFLQDGRLAHARVEPHV